MKVAALFAIIAALAILAGAFSASRHQAEREAWRVENDRLLAKIADLEQETDHSETPSIDQRKVDDAEPELAEATARLAAIETEILENRAELVQLKSDRLVADEYAKSSFDKLQEHIRKTADIEKGLAELQSRRLHLRQQIGKAEKEVSALADIIDERRDHAMSLDRRVAELAIREETARSRLRTAEEAETSIAAPAQDLNGSPVQAAMAAAPETPPPTPSESAGPKTTDKVVRQASTALAAADGGQDRSMGLYRFKSLSVDLGAGGPPDPSGAKIADTDDSGRDEKTASHIWASQQYEMGRILLTRAETNSGTRELNEAVLAFKAVLGEWPEDRDPLRWAATQSDLGYALALLGQRQGDVGTLEDAATACRKALAAIKEDRTPLLWAAAQFNLGLSLSGMAGIKNDEILWKNAIEALQRSVETFEEQGDSRARTRARDRLQNAHDALASLKKQS